MFFERERDRGRGREREGSKNRIVSRKVGYDAESEMPQERVHRSRLLVEEKVSTILYTYAR